MWPKHYIRLVVALAAGTILEWYEFGVYSQLDPYLSKLFFPASDPQLQQLSFYASYAVGFIARPFGGLIFGHLGDVRSRGLSLMISIIGMATPTVLMGALPTYEMIGVAAPILLVCLRLIQGLALGGEFGTAMVYFYETAPPGHQCLMGALGYTWPCLGIMSGMIVVLVMEAITTDAQMFLWGWRVPYFLSLITSVAGIMLRRGLSTPPSHTERLHDLKEGSVVTPPGLARELSARLTRSISSTMSGSTLGRRLSMNRGPSTVAGDGHLVAVAEADKSVTEAAAAAAVEGKLAGAAAGTGDAGEGESVVVKVPLWTAIKEGYWVEMLLHNNYLIWLSCVFWTFTTWAPTYLQHTYGISRVDTLAMVITAICFDIAGNIIAGFMGDAGAPRMAWSVAGFAAGGAAIAPVMLGWSTANLGAIYPLWALMFFICGFVQGFMVASFTPLYPPEIRATAFNVPYCIANGVFGGLSPVILTAISTIPGINQTFAPAYFLGPCAAVSLVSTAVLWWLRPVSNRGPTAAPSKVLPQ